MKAQIGRLVTSVTLLIAIPACLYAQGYIVPNGITYAGYTPSLGSEIHVLQNPTNGDYTGFNLISQDLDTFAISFFLDEGVRVFLVTANQPVALQPILLQMYPEFLGVADFEDGVPFYMGLYTGYNPWDEHGGYTGIYSNPVFGWAQLVNNGGVIELLDSALAYNAAGIYAGTSTLIPVPEPSAISLAGFAGMLYLLLTQKTPSGRKKARSLASPIAL